MQIVSPQQSSISYLSQSWLRCYKEGKLNHRSTFKVNLFFLRLDSVLFSNSPCSTFVSAVIFVILCCAFAC